MNQSLDSQLKRAKELINELETEYDKCLETKDVSDKAKILTHEIIEKLSNILDQAARKIWQKNVAPVLSEEEKEKAIVYFPKSEDRHSFDSTIGRWRIKNLEAASPSTFNFLLSKQPFSSAENSFLSILGKLAPQKHIDLIPQKREEVTHIKISSQSGTVHFITENVRFGAGVSILGAPVDPVSQCIIPTPGVEEKIEKWVSFVIEGYNLNALDFCQKSHSQITTILQEATPLM